MKKITMIGFCSLFFVFCFINGAMAAQSIAGTWKGSAQKVTTTQCSSVNITVTLNQCKYNDVLSRLVRGTGQIGSKNVRFVGRINDDKTVLLQGTEISVGSTVSAQLLIMRGTYTAPSGTAKAKITINQMAFVSATVDIETEVLSFNGNEMYDVFTLTKQ